MKWFTMMTTWWWFLLASDGNQAKTGFTAVKHAQKFALLFHTIAFKSVKCKLNCQQKIPMNCILSTEMQAQQFVSAFQQVIFPGTRLLWFGMDRSDIAKNQIDATDVFFVVCILVDSSWNCLIVTTLDTSEQNRASLWKKSRNDKNTQN